jgi:Fur family transcriptional regulator, ferric uptake regulator
MSLPNSLLQYLKDRGYRITAGRMAIVRHVAGTRKPFTAAELQTALKKKGLTANKATAYRELGVLQKEGILRPVTFDDGIQRFELHGDDHHHHLLCEKCGTVEDVHMDNDLDDLEQKISKEKKFMILRHSLEFYGLCAKCR